MERRPLSDRERQFYEYIRNQLLGDRGMPTAQQLAARFQTTVTNAYNVTGELVRKGWIKETAAVERKEKLAARKRCEFVEAYVRDAPEGTRLRIVVQGDRPEGEYIGNKRNHNPDGEILMGPPRYRVDAIIDRESAEALIAELERYLRPKGFTEIANHRVASHLQVKETTVGKEA